MSKYDCEVEKYVVHYGESKKRAFDEAENALNFAREKMNEGIEVEVKQINILVGWY